MQDLIHYLETEGIQVDNPVGPRYKSASLDITDYSDISFQKAASMLSDEQKEQLEVIALLQAMNMQKSANVFTNTMGKVVNTVKGMGKKLNEWGEKVKQPAKAVEGEAAAAENAAQAVKTPTTEPNVQQPQQNVEGVKTPWHQSQHFQKYAPWYAGGAALAVPTAGAMGYAMGNSAGKSASERILPPVRKSATQAPKNYEALKNKNIGGEGKQALKAVGKFLLKPGTVAGAGLGAAGLVGAAHLWNSYKEDGGE